MPVTQHTYRAVALEDPEGQWELDRGRLREKPSMSVSHNRQMARLVHMLNAQLSMDEFEVRMNTGRLRFQDETYFVPDVHVVPVSFVGLDTMAEESLDVLDRAVPLVVEVWSPSTGGYDDDRKIPEYRRRGDLEIWRIHPFDKILTMWRRRPDGTHAESSVGGGLVAPSALPGVTVDLDELFASG